MINNSDEFIYVTISDEMRANAEKAANEYKDKLHNSLLAGRGTMLGCLGEEMFHKAFPYMK